MPEASPMSTRDAHLINRFARMRPLYDAKLRAAVEVGDTRAASTAALRYTLAENGPRR